MDLSAIIEARLYAADDAAYRVLPYAADGRPGIAADGLRASVTAAEGYRDATITLLGKPGDFEGLVRRRRLELWAVYRSRRDGSRQTARLWRGRIKRIVPSVADKGVPTLTVSAYGLWSDAARQSCDKRWANVERADRSTLFSQLVQRLLGQGKLPPNTQVQNVLTGTFPDYFDAGDVTLGEAVERLTANIGRIATGADVDEAGRDRLFFRPFEVAGGPVHTIHLPDPQQVGSYRREEDATKGAPVLEIRGGSIASGARNLLAEAVQGNPSFEFPVLPGEGGEGNLVTNPSFEAGATNLADNWDILSGATVKRRSDENVTPYSGDRYLELDTVGERAYQLITPAVAIPTGAGLSFDVRCRLANDGKGATGRLRVQPRTSGGAAVGSPFDVTLSPAGVAVWEQQGDTRVWPAGAPKLSVETELTARQFPSDASCALQIDEVRVYLSGAVQQRGWQPTRQGDAFFRYLRWDDDSAPWHGSRCVAFDVFAADSDGQDASIEPFGFNRFSVTGGGDYVAGFVIRKHPDSGNFKVQPELHEWGADGASNGSSEQAHTITSTGFTVVTVSRSFAEDAAQGTAVLRFRGSGRGYVDGAFVCSSAFLAQFSDPATYLETDQFRAVLRAVDLFADGDPIHEEAEALSAAQGEFSAVEDRPEVTTLADAETYARDWFARYLPAEERPEITTYGILETGDGLSTATMMPGETVRAIGPDAEDVLPVPLPLTQKDIGMEGGKVVIRLWPGTAPREMGRTLEGIERRAKAAGRVQGGAAGSFGGGISGGGGASGSGLSNPVTTAQIADGAVTLAKLAALPLDSLIVRTAAGMVALAPPTINEADPQAYRGRFELSYDPSLAAGSRVGWRPAGVTLKFPQVDDLGSGTNQATSDLIDLTNTTFGGVYGSLQPEDGIVLLPGSPGPIDGGTF